MERFDEPLTVDDVEAEAVFAPHDITVEFEPDAVDDEPPITQQQYSRRQFFHLAIQAAAAAHAVDAIGAESLRWNRDEPSFTRLESDQTMEKYKHHMTVLMPGLGVPGSSAANMTYTLKPSLEPYGQVAYVEYPDTGLNARSFRQTAEGLQTFFRENEVHNVSFICHSAGGSNMNRVLRAPVEGWGFLGAGIGRPRILGEAWRYWEDADISIDNVTYVSSPPTGAFIKGDAQQEFSKAVGVFPDAMLHAGIAEKFIGNVINNHTLGFDHFENEGDRWAASARSALDSYSARDWLTQLKVLQAMTTADYRGVLSPHTGITVIRPTDPNNDTVVLTARLREAWAHMHGRSVESVRDYQSPVIGHANIYQQHEAFSDIFQRLYGSLYPPAVR